MEIIIKIFFIIILVLLWFYIENLIRKNLNIPVKISNIENNSDKYKKFKLYINGYVSLIHAVISFIFNFYFFRVYGFNSGEYKQNYSMEAIFTVSCSYFIYDFISGLKLKFEKKLLIHHIFIIIPILICLFYKKLYGIIIISFVFGEISNPPYLIAKALEAHDKFVILQKINFLIFAFLFCILRSYYIYPYYYSIWRNTPVYFYFNYIIESIFISDFKFNLDIYYNI